MTTNTKTILVTGATGQAGNAVMRHLAASGKWRLRALTRNPDSSAAKALAQSGVEVMHGDLKDKQSVSRAVAGVYGVYSVQTYWEHGAETEIRMGKDLADAAEQAGVEHFIFQSAGSRHSLRTGASHLDTKRKVEAHIRASALSPACTIIRPVAFMENFFLPGWRRGILQGILAMPMSLSVANSQSRRDRNLKQTAAVVLPSVVFKPSSRASRQTGAMIGRGAAKRAMHAMRIVIFPERRQLSCQIY